MILDYSKYVEVVGREADATAYPYFPSDLDFQHVAPRLLSQFKELCKVVPSSWSTILLKAFGQDELTNLLDQRVSLFNSIEDLAISLNESSMKRSLTDWMGSICYICKTPTQIVRNDRAGSKFPHVRVRACPACGWWESENLAYLELGQGISYDSFTLLRRACLREFAIIDDDAPMNALRTHLKKHPKDLNRISPRKLELLVGSVFSDFFSCEVIHVGGPRDGGIDLLLLMSDNPAIVQVKQRIDSKKTEPVSTIREFIGAMALEGHKYGFFVSSASRFSQQAQDAADKAESVVVESLELMNASKLIDILKLVSNKAEPWRRNAHSLDDELQDFGRCREAKFMSFYGR